MSSDNAEEILGTYKRMMAECQQIATKVSEVVYLLFLRVLVFQF